MQAEIRLRLISPVSRMYRLPIIASGDIATDIGELHGYT